MKKIFLCLVCLSLLSLIALVPNSWEDFKKGFVKEENPTTSENKDVLSSSTVEKNENFFEFEYKNQLLRVLLLRVGNLSLLTLIPNFEEKLTADEIIESKGCENLISGSFYSKEDTPIGLFITDEQIISDFQSNNLLNGIFSINDFDTPRITRSVPSDHLRLALQSGPMIIENSYQNSLAINNDKQARRIVAAVTGSNELYFLAIYDKASVFSGPYLVDLPEIMKKIETDLNIVFADVINLDGGKASFFYNGNIKLTELSPVGSFFCLK